MGHRWVLLPTRSDLWSRIFEQSGLLFRSSGTDLDCAFCRGSAEHQHRWCLWDIAGCCCQRDPICGLASLSSLGFSSGPLGLISTVPSVEGVPSISIGGAYGTSLGVVANAIQQVNDTYQLGDVFSKVLGLHSLKFGGEVRDIQVNEYNISSPNGTFTFDGTETGNGFADYLLGAVASMNQQSYSTFFTMAYYGGIFAQDSYRIRPNLTINAGVRWDIIQPYYEKKNRLNAIDWGVQSKEYPGSPTGWIFPGDQGLPSSISKTPLYNFSPRLGINWSPTASDGFLHSLLGADRAAARCEHRAHRATGLGRRTGRGAIPAHQLAR